MSTLQAVLFDLDRTLLDRDAALDAYARWLWKASGEGSSRGEACFVARFARLDAHGKRSKHEYFRLLKEEFSLKGELQDILDRFESLFPWTLRPFPEALPTLELLVAEGLSCGVITNGHTKGQKTKLGNSGLQRFLSTTIISKEVGLEKPDPRIFALALDELGLSARQTLFVGDSEDADVAGANNAGLISVLLRHPDNRAPTAADYQISSLTELPSLVHGLRHRANSNEVRVIYPNHG